MSSSVKLANENGKVTTISSGSSTTDITVDGSKLLAQTDTIATLKAMVETPSTIYVTGYTTADDGAFGSHFFKWNSASVATDNGGTVIKLDGIVTGRYELQYEGAVNVKWFGAKGDGVTDDTPVLQSVVDVFKNIYLPVGVYSISAPLLITTSSTHLHGLDNNNTYIVQSTPDSNTLDIEKATDTTVSGLLLYAKGTGSCIYSYGTARLTVDGCHLLPAAADVSYGITLSDKDKAGVFSPGAYSHTIKNNKIGITTGNRFVNAIRTYGTAGGQNDCYVGYNRLGGGNDVIIDWPDGGGNSLVSNQIQSNTSSASGTGLSYDGGWNIIGNYFEKLLYATTSAGTSSRANLLGNNLDDIRHTYGIATAGALFPLTSVNENGIDIETFNNLTTYISYLSGDTVGNADRITRVTGNGVHATGVRLGQVGARTGMRKTIRAGTTDGSGWGLELLEDVASDFSLIGNNKIRFNTIDKTLPNVTQAEFLFIDTKWVLVDYVLLVPNDTMQSISMSSATLLDSKASFYYISAGSSSEITLTNGFTRGQKLGIYANSGWSPYIAHGGNVKNIGAVTQKISTVVTANSCEYVEYVWAGSVWRQINQTLAE